MKHNHLSTPRKIAAMGRQMLLPALVFLLLLSCSKDDDSEPGIVPVPVPPPASTNFLKATIGGTEYNFDRIIVDTETVIDGSESYVDLNVTATINDDPTKEIIFNLEQDVPGTETIYYLYLQNNGTEYDTDHDAIFNTNVTTNANKRIIGTFSGTLGNFDGGETIEIQSASFDISY